MSSDEPAFLEVAARLAHEIAESAIWCDGRCNWVGALAHDESRISGRVEVAALGPDLYGGTSGVALFLAEAGASLEDEGFQTAARGAMRVALDHANRIDPQVRDGLYDGYIGIAYAAARVAELLGAEGLYAGARELLATWRRDTIRSEYSDVMSGCAGAVVGLVALSQLIDEPWLIETAARLGDELIARADAGRAGLSWAAPRERSMQNLCGYAHGAAGVGHALAELYGATGDTRYREAGGRAFDYERSWLDIRTGTWPDLRGIARRAGNDAPAPAADSWCNGAPGIALSRLRARELLRSRAVTSDAELALAACERHIADLVKEAPNDFCLCHGAAGAADVLLDGAAGREDVAAQLGHMGIEMYAGRGPGFPCGLPLGETPGLMLGFAGIGMFYLRLVDSGMQSPLLIHRTRG